MEEYPGTPHQFRQTILVPTFSLSTLQAGFVASHDNKIHKTTNAGLSWNLSNSSSYAYGQIQFLMK